MEANIFSTVSLIISVLSTVVIAVNHKRLRSKCCRQEIVASFDIENTTPPSEKKRVEVEVAPPPPIVPLALAVRAPSQ